MFACVVPPPWTGISFLAMFALALCVCSNVLWIGAGVCSCGDWALEGVG